jgi:hypothetical protein
MGRIGPSYWMISVYRCSCAVAFSLCPVFPLWQNVLTDLAWLPVEALDFTASPVGRHNAESGARRGLGVTQRLRDRQGFTGLARYLARGVRAGFPLTAGAGDGMILRELK